MVLQVPLDHALGSQGARLVSRQGGHGPCVHRVKIAPCGQHVWPPARWCAAGARWHEATRQALQQPLHFSLAAGIHPWGQHLPQVAEHSLRLYPICLRRLAAVDQHAGQLLQAFPSVALVAPGVVAGGLQHGWARPLPRVGPIGRERVERTQPQVVGQRLQQAALPHRCAAAKAGQGHERVGALTVLRRCPEAVQPVADLRLFELTQVAVQAVQQGFTLVFGFRLDKAQVFVQAVLQHVGQDVFAQAACPQGVERQGLDVLVHLPLQLQQRAVGFGPRQGGHQVVDDDGLCAPLGLAALAGVVDDEGVQVWQRAQQQVGPAVGPQGHAFAGQPFEVAVFAHVHHRIHLKLAAQPEVKRQVGVRGHQIGIVVAHHTVHVPPTGGLNAHEHMAPALATDHEATGAHHGVCLGLAPQVANGCLVVWRQAGKVGQVVGHGQALAHATVVVLRQVVGHIGQQAGHQGIAVGGQRLGGATGVPALRLQGVQDVHGRRRGVQPHAVGHPGIVAGVVGQDEGHPLVGNGRVAQVAPAARQLGHEGDAVRLRLVAQHLGLCALTAPRQAFEADGAGDDAPVHLGQHHLHGQVAGVQAMRVGLPLSPVTPGGDELQHRGIARPVVGG